MAPAAPAAAEPTPSRASAGQELAALLRADMGSASAPGVPGRDGSAAPPMEPEPKAVLWAKRNRWFGTDQEMTAYAYDMHEQLVGVEGISAESDEYYSQLDRRIAERFPHASASRTTGGSRPPASPSKSYMRQAPTPDSGFSARTSIKAPLPFFSPSDSPKHAARAASVRRRIADMGAGRSSGVGSPSASVHALGYGGVSPSGRALKPSRSRGELFDAPFNSGSYARYKQDVLTDLRAAKEEAESERKRILMQIGRTLHRKWH